MPPKTAYTGRAEKTEYRISTGRIRRMPAFLKDLSKFYGDGSRNRSGETLEEFLENYDPDRYRTPACTTDAVVFASQEETPSDIAHLKLLLVRRSNHPSIGCWALPGGFAEMEEDLDMTARRELEEETGVENLPMEQFAVYGDYDRDPRTRVITTAYVALVQESKVKVQAGDDAADAAWCEVKLTKQSEREEGEWIHSVYSLRIQNEEKGLDTQAKVREVRRKGLIREQKFRVEEAGMIAVDHAAVIVQAMKLLDTRIRHASQVS